MKTETEWRMDVDLVFLFLGWNTFRALVFCYKVKADIKCERGLNMFLRALQKNVEFVQN